MKKKRLLIVCIIALILSLTACGSGSNSIVGTWTVKEYQYEDESVSPDKAVEYFGVSFENYNKTKFVFQSSGHVKVEFPMNGTDKTLDYTVTDDLIEVYDDTHSEYLTLDGNKIAIEVADNLYMILKK